MNEIKFQLPNIFDSNYNILTLPRGKERRFNHFQIVIETLRVVYPQLPSRNQLQKLVRIRRKRFIEVLKYLIETGEVIRVGTGTKNDSFKYRLSDRNLKEQI